MAKTTTETVQPQPAFAEPVEKEQAAPQPQPEAQDELVTLQLQNQYINNRSEAEGGIQVFGPGRVSVPANIADDLLRREQESLAGERAVIYGAEHTKNKGHLA